MKLFRERFPQTPTVIVDTGYFMDDERDANGNLSLRAIAKNEWVAKAYDQFPVEVINLSSHDLSYFSAHLAKQDFARRAKAQPLLDRLLSANTISASADKVAPRPFLIRELPSKSAGGKARPLRVAFIGLTETTPPPPPGFKFIDPVEAARRVVPEAKKKADLIVVLAKARSNEATRIAREVPGIDVIVAGNAQGIDEAFTPPLYAGPTLIVFTPFETRLVGELRVYRSADGKFSTRQRFISIDEKIPDDPEAKQSVESAKKAEAEAYRKQ